MGSGILGIRALSAPLTKQTEGRLNFWGIAGLLLEDVPQLALQARILHQLDHAEGTATLSMLVTLIAIGMGIMMRIWSLVEPSFQRAWEQLFVACCGARKKEFPLEKDVDDDDDDAMHGDGLVPELPQVEMAAPEEMEESSTAHVEQPSTQEPPADEFEPEHGHGAPLGQLVLV